MEVIVITFDRPSSAIRDLSSPRRPAGSAIEPVATIVPCPGISRGTEATVPMPAGVGERDVRSLQVVGRQRAVARLGDQVLVDLAEAGEVHAVAALDHGHDQRARAVLALDVDGEPEVRRTRGTIRCGLPSTSANEWPIAGWSRAATAIA